MSSDHPQALVTGAARRIGAAICRRLHAAGFGLVLHYRRSRDQAEALAAELNAGRPDSAQLVQGDLSDADAVTRIADETRRPAGRLDLLVNNASAFFPTAAGRVTDAQWDALMDTNLKAPFFLLQALAPTLAERGGSAVNIADIHGDRPLKGYPVYSISKAGVVMLTKTLARELGPDVRVNAVAPGSILWPEGDHGDEVARAGILERTALKRQGTPDDIAQAVEYLARADYVTGHVLNVDGGRSLSS